MPQDLVVSESIEIKASHSLTGMKDFLEQIRKIIEKE